MQAGVAHDDDDAPGQWPDGADLAPLQRLYVLTAPRLLAVARALVDERVDAERVVEDVFVRLWQEGDAGAIDAVDGSAELFDRTRRLAVERRERRRSASPSWPDGTGRAADGRSEADVRAVLRAVEASTARTYVSALPDGPRQALALALYEGLGRRDIAARLGQDVGTVKAWLRQALKGLVVVPRDAGSPERRQLPR